MICKKMIWEEKMNKVDQVFIEFCRKEPKNVVLSMRVTRKTKQHIEELAKKYHLSQSDIVTVLVENAIQKEKG